MLAHRRKRASHHLLYKTKETLRRRKVENVKKYIYLSKWKRLIMKKTQRQSNEKFASEKKRPSGNKAENTIA